MIITGNAIDVLRTLGDESVQTCVTSPPYWGLRDYGLPPTVWDETVECEHEWVTTRQYKDSPIRSGAEGVGFDDAAVTKAQRWREQNQCHCGAWRGCLGLEPTPELFVSHLVQIFREVRRVLRKDGTIWVNLGDSYCSTAPGSDGDPIHRRGIFAGVSERRANGSRKHRPETPSGMKPKDLVGIPWMTAFALRADGWYLRSDIIWSKPNPMPESVTDRPTKAHEYVFLLSKSAKYFYDAAAIAEPWVEYERERRVREHGNGLATVNNIASEGRTGQSTLGATSAIKNTARRGELAVEGTRNRWSVWTVTTVPYREAHFATFPEKLIEPCVLAGAPVAGVVLDPFCGAGTTGVVAFKHDREFIGIELNPAYVEMAERRIAQASQQLRLVPAVKETA